MVIVVMEGENPLTTMHGWAESREPFDVWFKTQAQEVSGVDFSQPEHSFAWRK